MTKKYNFAAGASVLPGSVIKALQEELSSYKGSGLSILELPHRSSIFQDLLDKTKADLRQLAAIPDDYEILFVPGGATLQFSMVPMNLMLNGKADYFLSGRWSVKAAREAVKFGDVRVAASSEAGGFQNLPDLNLASVRQEADYAYICENNTIYGTKFRQLPEVGQVPLVADLSSCIFSEPLDISRYRLIFACAQKNLGTAGVTLVIIHKDLIHDIARPLTPKLLSYRTYKKNDSMYNTPPVYAIYTMSKVVEWLLDLGGLERIQMINKEKAEILYNYLDSSHLFRGLAAVNDRSLMNVPFITRDRSLDARFISEAQSHGLLNLAGHPVLGGMRASLYNAMPLEGVNKLVAFMREFERDYEGRRLD